MRNNTDEKILKIIGVIAAVFLTCFLLLLLVLIITEYKPADFETLEIAGEVEQTLQQGQTLDGFILSNNLKVESFETVDLGFINSDHNPLRLKVTLE